MKYSPQQIENELMYHKVRAHFAATWKSGVKARMEYLQKIGRSKEEAEAIFYSAVATKRDLDDAVNFYIDEDALREIFSQPLRMDVEFASVLKTPFEKVFVNLIPGVGIDLNKANSPYILRGILFRSNPKGTKEKYDEFERANPELASMIKQKSFSLMPPEVRGLLDSQSDFFFEVFLFVEKDGEFNGMHYQFAFQSDQLPKFWAATPNITDNMDESSPNWGDLTKAPETFLLIEALKILFYLTASNIEYVPWRGGIKSELHRSRKGLPPKKAKYYWCRVHYPTQMEDLPPETKHRLHPGYNFTFDVRGHFRQFNSDRFVNKQGTKVWISPFKKGHGIYIPKRYYADWLQGKPTEESDNEVGI